LVEHVRKIRIGFVDQVVAVVIDIVADFTHARIDRRLSIVAVEATVGAAPRIRLATRIAWRERVGAVVVVIKVAALVDSLIAVVVYAIAHLGRRDAVRDAHIADA